MLKVETICKHTIKPSSHRPPHSSLQLSSRDQTAPQIFIHILLFYTTTSPPPDETQLSTHLKSSLSQTLAHFYPLAGRIRLSQSTNTLHVECNDEGVEFVEARAEADLASFLTDHDPVDQFTDLLPIKVTEFRWVDDPLLAVQLTVFAGNAFAIGVSVSHLIADGASISSFLRCWSNIARRGLHPNGPAPCRFDSASVFPPRSSLSDRRLPERSKDTTGNSSGAAAAAIGRFLIAPQAMERLRGRTATRVEAVSALVWRCLNRTRGKAGSLSHVVNLRNKMSPPLSACTIGNLFVSVVAPAEGSVVGQEEAEVAVRKSVRKVDREYVRRREMECWESEGEVCWIFSSWCRMDWYRNDFGWGEPIWFGCGIRDMKDVCILIDA